MTRFYLTLITLAIFQLTQAQLADEFAASYAELVEVAAVNSGLFD